MRPPRYAIIPTNGRECVTDCIDAILPQVDHVIAVCTAPQMRGKNSWYDQIHKLYMPGPINISHWWNWGLDAVRISVEEDLDQRPAKWDVAILNDDVIVPEGWFDAVAGKMRELKAAAACSGGTTGMPILHTHAGPVPLSTRMQGFAFIVAGESGLRADEQFRWYCGDDDLGWRAAGVGGMVMIPGFHVNHLYPNQQVTPEMQELIAEDMQRFVDKWGQRPW
jgi:hypothetical protein